MLVTQNHTDVTALAPSIVPVALDTAGQNRLQGGDAFMSVSAVNTEIYGFTAHAAVRMHASPVTENFWVCPKFKTTHFQRRKVAT